jgi:protein-disulfide isomerase
MNRMRLILLAGAAVLAAVVVVVFVLIGTGGGSSGITNAVTTTGGTSGTEAQSTFAGVPQHGTVLGKATAPTTLAIFEDPQCPYCRQFNIDTLPTVVANYVRTGRIKIEYHGVVVIGVNSVAGLRAIYAAGQQNKLWNMAEALYERQGDENSGWITVPVIRDAATEVHVNAAMLLKAADSKAVTAQLNASATLAQQDQVNSTPTFIVLKELGAPQQLQVDDLEPAGFTATLDAALQ